jgi:hypothetical protein
MPSTPNYGFPYPAETDSPDGPTQIQALASAVDTQVATNAARSTLVTTLLGTAQTVNTTLTTAIATSTSTSFVFVRDTSANILGAAFVAPPSGKVLVRWAMSVNTTSGVTVLVAVAVQDGTTLGSGTVEHSAADTEAFSSATNSTVPGSHEIVVSGLTPGSSYNACALWRISAGAGTISGAHPEVTVQPLIT